MSFTDSLWAEAAPIRVAIRDMPFNAELAAGTLARPAFRHYMLQDALYLEGFARALALAAARAPDADTILELAQAAGAAIQVERALHAGYLEQFGVSVADLASAQPSPVCDAYVNSLLAAAAIGSFGELAAAVLPCFWVYREIGLSIKASAAPQNFYQAWIDTYSDEAFGAATARMIALVERAGTGAGAAERTRMAARFHRCCQYEYLFWDSAYRQAQWPFP